MLHCPSFDLETPGATRYFLDGPISLLQPFILSSLFDKSNKSFFLKRKSVLCRQESNPSNYGGPDIALNIFVQGYFSKFYK